LASEVESVVTITNESAKTENLQSLSTGHVLDSIANKFAFASRGGSFSLDYPLYRALTPHVQAILRKHSGQTDIILLHGTSFLQTAKEVHGIGCLGS
jgi:hypothetical protein